MDIPIIDRVSGMESGIVLNFSNRTFANCFHEEFRVDIYDDRWATQCNTRPTAFAATFGGQNAAQRSKLSRRFGNTAKQRHLELFGTRRLGAHRLLPGHPTPRGQAAQGARCNAARSTYRSGRNLRPCRPSARSLHHGSARPRLCLRNLPERRIRRSQDVRALLFSSQGRADRRQFCAQ